MRGVSQKTNIVLLTRVSECDKVEIIRVSTRYRNRKTVIKDRCLS